MSEIRRLSVALLALSVGLIIAGLATSSWGCGNLFEECQNHGERTAVVSVIILLLLGLVCLSIVLLLDLVSLCSDTFSTQAGYLTTRFVLLYLGSGCLLAGILVFTGLVSHRWSYFAATVGCVFALQVALLAILSSRCVATRDRIGVRAVRA
ncbi:unnamed protein product [Dicrocoelium dendriticum]|nr:unnamed protein product [Dicrocoelium dendriticum]